ncbi:hypothetical protein C8F01DRAFT_1091551 [Mycena amicta]|nr:hypothetical protein C8F01DRAFT_1091551 [Mycena amicta]
MANNAPDEILTEILRPLLKHSDAAFSDTSEKPLLAVHGFEVSSYLLVNKAWLRASTPLLYSVVILRTTAQAVAVERVLKRYPDIGNYILKLRVEGGFGTAMHTILRCATRLRELFISLVISASDNVKGLCSGLPLVNPHSVYLYDRNYHRNGFAKNKKVDELLQTVISLIPKWNNLAPHLITQAGRRAIDTRAEKLISALVLSQRSRQCCFPRTLQFRRGLAADYAWCSKEIEKHPKLLLYAEFPLWERDRGIEDPNEDAVLIGDFGTNSNQSDDDNRECTVTERCRGLRGRQSAPAAPVA